MSQSNGLWLAWERNKRDMNESPSLALSLTLSLSFSLSVLPSSSTSSSSLLLPSLLLALRTPCTPGNLNTLCVSLVLSSTFHQDRILLYFSCLTIHFTSTALAALIVLLLLLLLLFFFFFFFPFDDEQAWQRVERKGNFYLFSYQFVLCVSHEGLL